MLVNLSVLVLVAVQIDTCHIYKVEERLRACCRHHARRCAARRVMTHAAAAAPDEEEEEVHERHCGQLDVEREEVGCGEAGDDGGPALDCAVPNRQQLKRRTRKADADIKVSCLSRKKKEAKKKKKVWWGEKRIEYATEDDGRYGYDLVGTQRACQRNNNGGISAHARTHAPRTEGPTATSTSRETSSPRARGLASPTRHGSATTRCQWTAKQSSLNTRHVRID